jgi:hypothetical protein
MTPGAEGSGLGCHSILPGQLGNQMPGNQIAHLPEYATNSPCWLTVFVSFFHPRLVAGSRPVGQHFFYPLWDGSEFFSKIIS